MDGRRKITTQEEAALLWGLCAVIRELSRFNLKATGHVTCWNGHPGVTVTDIDFTTSDEVVLDRDHVLEWAQIVATLARGARA